MQKQQIFQQLSEIFAGIFDDENIHLTPETTASDVEGWDSFNHINLIVAIESRFGIKFKTAELDSLHNVGELVDAIGRRTA